MAIGFNNIPTTLRVPWAYIEFDNSRAQQGPSVQPFQTLMLGQKLAAGTAAANVPVRVTSEAQARTLFGGGSHLQKMVEAYLANDKVTPLYVIPQADDGAAVEAEKTLTVTGPATASGTLKLYFGGQVVNVSVTSGDTANTVAAAINTAINAATDLLFTSTVATNVVTVVARNGGAVGETIDIRLNYYPEDETPAGIAVVIASSVTGATNPDISAAIAAMPDEQYNFVVMPYQDTANLNLLKVELDDRFGPLRQVEGVAVTARAGNLAGQTAFGQGRNDKLLTAISVLGPSPDFAWASAYAARMVGSAQQDPARPFQTLPLVGILAGSKSEQFSLAERNGLLFDGIATHKVAPGDVVVIERAITTFRLNTAGSPDVSYLDVETLTTLSYLRYDFRAFLTSKFPRHKLANDGTNFAPGQPVMTPSLGRAAAVQKFSEWELLGLVEGKDQFKRDLIVERNTQDVNRLDFLMPPDLINQLRVMGIQIAFLL